MIIKCKIAVNKIDKTKLFKGRKDTYLDVTLLENRHGEDEFGNHGMIVQDVSKEEREQGIKGAILGNFKIMGGGQGSSAGTRRTEKPNNECTEIDF